MSSSVTHILREDLHPTRIFVLPSILEGEGLFLNVSLVVCDDIPCEHMLLILKNPFICACFQADVGATDADDHMTNFTGVTQAVRKHHCIIVR